MTATTAGIDRPTSRVPAYRTLIGTVYAICVGLMCLSVLAEIALDHESDGPRGFGDQLIGLLGFGTAALVISVLGARQLRATPERARAGAVVFGLLCVPALAFFWCGMPGMFGATAASLAGLTRDGRPLTGLARGFGLVGLVLAILNPILHVVLIGGSWIAEVL